ncbi:hypothetical protein [Streptomyces sp. NPDC056544]|uniref:hypothetical protein n=1 Tax=unclassified Streptomyces TaxID=2593676 RepID=UPI0036C6E300
MNLKNGKNDHRMIGTGIDLDALPPDTLVTQNGKITPIGELVIEKMVEDLTAICQQSRDPQAALKALREIIPEQMKKIVSQPTDNGPSALRAALTGLAGSQCLERRPGRDPLTGGRVDGQPETDATFIDRLVCTQQHGHSGDHQDVLKRTWQQAELSV